MSKQVIDDQIDYLFKIVMVGQSGAGKSQIIERYTRNNFNQHQQTTIGVQFAHKNIRINDKTVKLQIWDTAGQQRFRSLTKAFFKGAAGVVLVYDTTSQRSFQQLDNWYSQIYDFLSKSQCITILVGNKIDMQSERKIKKQKGFGFAQSRKLAFIQASAKTGQNINKIFSMLAEQLVSTLQNPKKKQNDSNQKQQLDQDGEPVTMSQSQIKLNRQSVINKSSGKSSCC